ncbi:PACE efflux transporter [Ancylobacter terrae]|uniref:PACE efflux transporter n=1 Tax=Ancylobacter sp. sgz301288 TaxID=3342077 RepID=UPI0038590388
MFYVAAYEAIAIIIATYGLTLLSGQEVAHTGPVVLIVSTIAVAWNFLFNSAFEHWESRQAVRGRSLARRIGHALGFEFGLTLLIVPLFAWWLDVTLVEAFLYDFALIFFFLVYTFLFNLAFDKLFGLPASAR